MRTTFLRPIAVAGRTEVREQDDGAACGVDVLSAEPSHGKRVVEHLHRAGSERSVTWLIGALQDPAGGSCEGYVGKRMVMDMQSTACVCCGGLCRPICL